MATFTIVQPSMDTIVAAPIPIYWEPQNYCPPHMEDYMEEAIVWANKVKQALTTIHKVSSSRPLFFSQISDEDLLSLPLDKIRLDDSLLSLPRRRRASDEEVEKANTIANLLYPAPRNSLGPIIKYAEGRTRISTWIQLRKKWGILHATKLRQKKKQFEPLRLQGPWDPELDPISLDGPSSIPMPVKVSTAESLKPFFDHLKSNGTSRWDADTLYFTAKTIEEPFYMTPALEFPKGVIYDDGRLDLCKMVVGPPHIADLIESLRTNTFITHFLLGNNIIGPIGARSIAGFVHDFPERIDTWYLAGNCIDCTSLSLLVNAFTTSPAVTNIWLKRNPLGPNAASDLFRLVTETPKLRTLDLDQTELGDVGVADLFSRLEDHRGRIALTNLYLNGNGIGPRAANAIGQYLAYEYCSITSIYMSNNPLGTESYKRLAAGIRTSHCLKRLSLQSTGLSDDGAVHLFASLQHHPSLTLLDVSQSFATQDLGQAYNYLTDASASSISAFLATCSTLEYFNMGSTAMTNKGMNTIVQEASKHPSLLQLNLSSINPQSTDPDSIRYGQEHARLSKLLRLRVVNNVLEKHGMTYENWEKKEKRWVISDELDVRKIDSVYRNRDMALARKGVKRLEKWWGEDDTTLEEIMKTAVGPVCTRRKKPTG